ncbi:MAG: isocitrate/isopropylmalate dehydrogenase family protein [Methanocellales archaeon]|nr:isocitrate/isopropylmalate dehydrogenase family protein [Methanocellales archaeon]
MTKKIAVIKGDGVGPELVDGAIQVLNATDHDFELILCDAGVDWWKKHGGESLIPEDTWDILKETDACFKGPTTTPGGEGTLKSVAVSIRQKLDLYANIRPIKTFPNTPKPLGDVDFICVREGTEGLYYGSETQTDENTYIALRRITRSACSRIAKYSFEEALRRGLDTVVAIHKSNILKLTCGVFLDEVRKVGKDYPDIEIWDYHVDNMAQQLIKNPQLFNQKVLLSTNLFMDILSEECSALVGSIGLIYSANFGDKYAMFEPAHGSAPKYAGKDCLNPTATILAGAWILEYLGENEKAHAIFQATEKVISEGEMTTYDLGGSARLSEMASAIAKTTEDFLG